MRISRKEIPSILVHLAPTIGSPVAGPAVLGPLSLPAPVHAFARHQWSEDGLRSVPVDEERLAGVLEAWQGLALRPTPDHSEGLRSGEPEAVGPPFQVQGAGLDPLTIHINPGFAGALET